MDRARTWAWAGVVGIALYVAIDVALVFLRPQLSVLHNAESDYGSPGPWPWLMDLDFVLRCLLSLAVVRALMLAVGVHGRLRLALALIATWAVTSGLLAFFPDDPVGTPLVWRGKVHVALALVAFA